MLQAMHRGYTREHYLDLVAQLRARIPDIVLTSDVIVGFPGETQEEFEETLSLIEAVRFDALFTFIFSPPRGPLRRSWTTPCPRSRRTPTSSGCSSGRTRSPGRSTRPMWARPSAAWWMARGRTAASPPAPPGAAGPPGGGARRHRHLAGSAGHWRFHLGAVWGTGGPVKAARGFAGPLWRGAAVIGRWSRWDRRRVGPATWFPPGPGRECGTVLRTLRVVETLTVPRGAAPWARLPGGAGWAFSAVGRWSGFWTAAG